eukprot:TRINITY_DN726_c1_g1_i1.p1 TRINITY_DN726_c1_g1~~TRINITY_DN726_c1_g1_i1.p1  ORF type:complete len:365 (+),score=68.37 TRINITY_DN726_c1_g1_i1:33-1097(+)
MDGTVSVQCETSINSVYVSWTPKIAVKAVLGRKTKEVDEGVGHVSFGNLACGNTYTVGILSSSGEPITKIRIQTKDPAFPTANNLKSFIHPRLHTTDLQWVHDVEDEYLWSRRELLEDKKFVRKLYREACFVLPSASSYMVVLPNPRKRYCIDLTKNVKWDRDKRMRKSRLSRYRLTMDRHFKKSVKAIRDAHSFVHGPAATWLDDDLCNFLEEDHLKVDPVTKIQHHTFELWEGDELLAVCAGFTSGAMWHDYTHAAVVRDERRAGTILTKTVGDLLSKCGYKLWYWGVCSQSTSYMSDYNSYGGGEFPREEFVPLWRDAMQSTPTLTPIEAMSEGLSLVEPASAEFVEAGRT